MPRVAGPRRRLRDAARRSTPDAQRAVRMARVVGAVVHPVHVAARPASRRACSATPAATRSRSRRRCGASSASQPGETMFCTSDIGWVVGHSYIVYGAADQRLDRRSCTKGCRSAPTPASGGRSSRSTHVTTMFSSPTAIRVLKKQDPAFMKQSRPVVAALPVPRRRAARRAHRALGRRRARRARSSTTTGRPRPGWPILSAQPGVEETPRKFGSPSFPVYGYDVKLVARGDRRGGRRRREGRADDRAAAAARLHDHRLGRRRALRDDVLRDDSRRHASIRRSTGRRATPTATTSCWAAPTT